MSIFLLYIIYVNVSTFMNTLINRFQFKQLCHTPFLDVIVFLEISVINVTLFR